MSEYRNKGYAQEAIELVEEIHGYANWELDITRKRKLSSVRSGVKQL